MEVGMTGARQACMICGTTEDVVRVAPGRFVVWACHPHQIRALHHDAEAHRDLPGRPDDPAEIAERIRKLCESNPKLAELAERIRKSYESHVWAPCNCCGACACPDHDGERHSNVVWCLRCIGRDHHPDEDCVATRTALAARIGQRDESNDV